MIVFHQMVDVSRICWHKELLLLTPMILVIHIAIVAAWLLNIPVLVLLTRLGPIIELRIFVWHCTRRMRKQKWLIIVGSIQLALLVLVIVDIHGWVLVKVHLLSLHVGRGLVSYVWRWLLIALIATECWELMKVERPVEMIKRSLLMLVVLNVALQVKINLHLRISTVCESIEMATLSLDIWWKKSTLVEIWSLVDCFISWGIEFNHHCGVHLWSSSVHCCGIYVV